MHDSDLHDVKGADADLERANSYNCWDDLPARIDRLGSAKAYAETIRASFQSQPWPPAAPLFTPYVPPPTKIPKRNGRPW